MSCSPPLTTGKKNMNQPWLIRHDVRLDLGEQDHVCGVSSDFLHVFWLHKWHWKSMAFHNHNLEFKRDWIHWMFFEQSILTLDVFWVEMLCFGRRFSGWMVFSLEIHPGWFSGPWIAPVSGATKLHLGEDRAPWASQWLWGVTIGASLGTHQLLMGGVELTWTSGLMVVISDDCS